MQPHDIHIPEDLMSVGGSFYAARKKLAHSCAILFVLVCRRRALNSYGTSLPANWNRHPVCDSERKRPAPGTAAQSPRSAIPVEHGIGRPQRFARPLGLPAN